MNQTGANVYPDVLAVSLNSVSQAPDGTLLFTANGRPVPPGMTVLEKLDNDGSSNPIAVGYVDGSGRPLSYYGGQPLPGSVKSRINLVLGTKDASFAREKVPAIVEPVNFISTEMYRKILGAQMQLRAQRVADSATNISAAFGARAAAKKAVDQLRAIENPKQQAAARQFVTRYNAAEQSSQRFRGLRKLGSYVVEKLLPKPRGRRNATHTPRHRIVTT